MEYSRITKRRRLSTVMKSLERLNLEDDGKRDWYKESVRYLDLHFLDWKDLKRTVMIPPAFPVAIQEAPLGDITEKRVYDLVEEFGKAYQQPMFVVHSHQFADLIEEKKKGFEGKMKKWNKGEHDFVIIHRKYGFIFLQVKSSTRKDGQAFKKAKWQVDKDIESIKTYLNDCFPTQLPPENMERVIYNYPAFVVMPNCQPTKSSVDPTGVFLNDCKDKESFKKWWDDKVVTSNKRVMNEELYEALLVRFVALHCLSPSIISQIDETYKQIVHFHTPEQLKCMLTAGAEQWWAGPAGSGKTVLLKRKVKEIAREIIDKEGLEKILVACFNKPLAVHLTKQFQDWWHSQPESKNVTSVGGWSWPAQSPIHVYTYDSFISKVFTEVLGKKDGPERSFQHHGEIVDRRRRAVEEYFEIQAEESLLSSEIKFHHIFVDEGQDFSGKKWLNVLKKFQGQDSVYSIRGYFWVFFDSNQHVQLKENESIFWLSSYNPFQLTKVLRNTENIFLLAKTYYSGKDKEKITLGHQEVGLNVKYDNSLTSDRSNGVDILNKHISELQQKKVILRDIVILTKKKMLDSSLQDLSVPYYAAEYPDYIDLPDDFVVVDSIRCFKGLESKIVILYDPPYKLDENIVETSALLYTAISRCFCYLLIVSTVDGCKAIKERVDNMKYGGKEEAERGDSYKDWD